jgi:hypothetical protein
MVSSRLHGFIVVSSVVLHAPVTWLMSGALRCRAL